VTDWLGYLGALYLVYLWMRVPEERPANEARTVRR